MKRLLLILAFCASAFAAGSVQQSLNQLGLTDNWVLAFQWTGDPINGSVPVTTGQLSNLLQGYTVTQVEIVPLTPGPTSGYSVKLLDFASVDLLGGAGTSLSASTAQAFASTVAQPLNGAINLSITGQSVAGARGAVYVYLQKIGSVNLSVGRTAATWTAVTGNPFNDIRTYGAVCDGATDQNTAVQSALSAGANMIFIPANCVWIAPSGLIPGATNGVTYIGENWITSVIKSASNPTTATLKYASGVKLVNLNLEGNTVNTPASCPVGYAINASTATQNIISTCYSSFDSFSGQDNVDRTAVFFKVASEPSGITGDGANFSNCVGYVGSGNPVNGTTGGCLFTGNSLRADTYAGATGLAAILATAMPGAVTGQAIISAVNNTGAGGVPQSPIFFSMFDTYRTVGTMIQANHRGTAYSGNALELDMADLSGSFTGNFVDFTNGLAQKFAVDSNGDATMSGSVIVPPCSLTLVNGANENVALPANGSCITTGPTGAYNIGGLTGGVSGRLFTLIENAGQILTVNHQDGSSSAANRIYVPAATNFACAHTFCILQFMYTGSQWHLIAPSDN